MKEERIPKEELAQFLTTLERSLGEIAALHDNRVAFAGIPIEEWAGPGYAVGALFDPNVLSATLKKSTIYLECPEASAALAGLTVAEKRTSQKDRISFVVNKQRAPSLHLPTLWGGVPYRRLEISAQWRTLATIAELPGLVAADGAAVFAFNPLKVIHRHLCMAEPSTTRDLPDLLVKAILGASGVVADLDDHDLRRDFHALGVSALLLGQLHQAVGKPWSVKAIEPDLRAAAKWYLANDHDKARGLLAGIFKQFEQKRTEIVSTPVYFIVMPHGGILFENEGYAEYDWPEAAARVLNLLLDWSDRFGFKFAPDIGAGTLEEFVKIHPRTIGRLRAAWEKGTIEFVNGSYSQPYTQLWPTWDQDKQFEIGLKTFEQLFGMRPRVYAAQEIALHPTLPDLLATHGFTHAIHRSQNLGLAPIDKAPLIDWQSPKGTSIRSLPSHPLRSERRGGEIWRHLPVLLTSARNAGLPFIAFTSLMDQTFIDIYNEEILRANQYAPVWGEFVTPSEFFARTASVKAEKRCHNLDDYHYDLDLSGNSIHGHQTGGYSSEHAFMFKEGARLRELESHGKLAEGDLKKLLNQEAHDCYIIPYFAPGYFMEGGLTDYLGPRYRCVNDKSRGINRCIRDAAGYPARCSDFAPSKPERCEITGTTLSSAGTAFEINPHSGEVVRIGQRNVSLGALRFDGVPFRAEDITSVCHTLKLAGTLPGFGDATLEYFINGGQLFCEVSTTNPHILADDTRICWGNCVYLEHAKPGGAVVERTVSGLTQPTASERFHSLDRLAVRDAGGVLHLGHGGNIFFRQTERTVQNRLWCYDEFCDRFWWSVQIDS